MRPEGESTDGGPHVLILEEGEGRRCVGPYPELVTAADAATAWAVTGGGLVIRVCPLQAPDEAVIS